MKINGIKLALNGTQKGLTLMLLHRHIIKICNQACLDVTVKD